MAKRTSTGPDAGSDRRRSPSGNGAVAAQGSSAPADSVRAWVERYLELAVRGVRSPEVAGGPLFALTGIEILWEASLAIHLTVKGYRPSPLLAERSPA